jgi:hypothetical protein
VANGLTSVQPLVKIALRELTHTQLLQLVGFVLLDTILHKEDHQCVKPAKAEQGQLSQRSHVFQLVLLVAPVPIKAVMNVIHAQLVERIVWITLKNVLSACMEQATIIQPV